MNSSKRHFSRRDKLALYTLADGLCENCGKPLEPGWHADHVIPFSKAGETDILNAQALCPDCNLKKGAKMLLTKSLPSWPDNKILRDWQQNALLEWETGKAWSQRGRPENFLAVATPGAGKTLFALKLAHQLLETKTIGFVVIVCPTSHLRKQWAEKAHDVGIDIDPTWTNSDGTFRDDFHGVAVTYQLVASGYNAPILRKQCSKKDTLVIFDEVHHAGDEKPWGSNMQTAFEPARFRLLISGTPFRTDNQAIPYVLYDQNVSQADYSYSYGDALRDGVCRPVFFPSFEGNMEWLSRKGKYMRASFSEELPDDQASERLRTALSPTGNWLPSVIREANDRLTQIREDEHKDAGGLVIAIDQRHAESIAKILQRITGETPRLAISDIPDASGIIDAFAKEQSRWLIAVKMVSEGVDIPRLRVLVYATNVTSELFFRQAVGRVIRVVENIEEQSALFYMPAVQILMDYAHAIKEEREHVMEEETEEDEEQRQAREQATTNLDTYFEAISSEAIPDNVIVDKLDITQEELRQAREYARERGFSRIPPEFIAQMMRDFMGSRASSTGITQPQPSKPKHSRIEDLRSQVKNLCAKYAIMTKTDFKDIHIMWMKLGGMPQNKATEEDLRKKKDWILGKIQGYEENSSRE